MKKIFFILLAISSINSFGQCTDCTSFENALKNPKEVKTIKINPWQHNVTLDSIPKTIGLFINTEIIYISDHNISELPKEIGNLKNVKELSFSGCKLTTLPEEIFLLNKLKELILLNNEFSDEYIKEIKQRFSKEMSNTKLLISRAN